jgi:TnpA family transposase
LAAVLVDGTNLGLTRMADASHGISYHHLVNVAQWHISDDNYVAARAAIVNAHHKHPMAAIWDDGTTASSDGQYFRAGGRAGAGGAINAKYGIEPGFVFYTQVSGRYSLFYTQVIAAMVSEAPYVLDGLMHHVHRPICASASTTRTRPAQPITCSASAASSGSSSRRGSRT